MGRCLLPVQMLLAPRSALLVPNSQRLLYKERKHYHNIRISPLDPPICDTILSTVGKKSRSEGYKTRNQFRSHTSTLFVSFILQFNSMHDQYCTTSPEVKGYGVVYLYAVWCFFLSRLHIWLSWSCIIV